jgi:hypothetical protein
MWGDDVGDPGVEGGDVRGEGVDAAQHGRADEPVVVVEVPARRLLQLRNLAAHHPTRQPGQQVRVALAASVRLASTARHALPSYAIRVEGLPRRAVAPLSTDHRPA